MLVHVQAVAAAGKMKIDEGIFLKGNISKRIIEYYVINKGSAGRTPYTYRKQILMPAFMWLRKILTL